MKLKSAKIALAEPQLQAVAGLFAVLSEPTRLRILQMLRERPANVTEIVERLEMKQANASKQLGILHQAGVVERQREGNQVRYSIRMPLVLDLCSLVCSRLREQAEEQLRQLGPA